MSTDGVICHVAVVVQEVLPGNGYLLAIEAENSFINLPRELFEKLNGSGIYMHFEQCKLCMHIYIYIH